MPHSPAPPARLPDRARRWAHPDPARPSRYAASATVTWLAPNGAPEAIRTVTGRAMGLTAESAVTLAAVDPATATEKEIDRWVFLGPGPLWGLSDAFDAHEIRADVLGWTD